MKIENRIAAFRESKFEEAFKDFDSFGSPEFDSYQNGNDSDICDWIEEMLEVSSSYLFYPDSLEISDEIANAIFGNPENWIILLDNLDRKNNSIRAIWIFEKEDFYSEKKDFIQSYFKNNPNDFKGWSISKI